MLSCKRIIAMVTVFCSVAASAWQAPAAAQTTASLKPGETAESAKTDDAAKTPDKAAEKAAEKTAEQTVSAVALPPGYVVGESDILHVNVWKEPDLSQTVVVRTDGNISLPLINDLKVSGLTPIQIQETIAARLMKFMTNPQVTVTVTDIRSKKAFITGEVLRPGSYSLNAQTSVLQLIAQAGGFTPFAKRDSIVVLRSENGKLTKMKFQYKEVVKGNKTEQNVALQP